VNKAFIHSTENRLRKRLIVRYSMFSHCTIPSHTSTLWPKKKEKEKEKKERIKK
jgi:hypothetical protein